MIVLIVAVVAFTLPIAPAGQQDGANPPRKDQAEKSARKIKELQKERIATLTELVDQTATLFRSGRASYEGVLEAQMLLLKASLDATEKESDRITLYERTVEALNQLEKVANALAQTGQGSQTAVLKIKARRLEVEIQLERARAREAKSGK
jgi:outer membrane protein TolC